MIHLDEQGSVVVLRLEHGKVNTLDTESLPELTNKLQEVEKSEARAAILTGTGQNFCGGVDLFRVVNGGKEYLNQFLPILTDGLYKLFTFRKPTIAAINGHAIAGGCILACACDYRIMSDNSGKIGVAELQVGVPFPSLPLEIVRFVVPKRHFQEVVYTAQTYDAYGALQRGLIDEVVKPENLSERAFEMAQQLGAIPTDSFQITKRLMRQPTLDRHQHYKQTIDLETEKIWASNEIRDIIRRYLEKTIRKKK